MEEGGQQEGEGGQRGRVDQDARKDDVETQGILNRLYLKKRKKGYLEHKGGHNPENELHEQKFEIQRDKEGEEVLWTGHSQSLKEDL